MGVRIFWYTEEQPRAKHWAWASVFPHLILTLLCEYEVFLPIFIVRREKKIQTQKSKGNFPVYNQKGSLSFGKETHVHYSWVVAQSLSLCRCIRVPDNSVDSMTSYQSDVIWTWHSYVASYLPLCAL